MSQVASDNNHRPVCYQAFVQDTRSKVITGVSSAAALGGLVLIALGSLALCGPIGGTGFFVSEVTGFVLVIGAGGTLTYLGVKNNNRQTGTPPQVNVNTGTSTNQGNRTQVNGNAGTSTNQGNRTQVNGNAGTSSTQGNTSRTHPLITTNVSIVGEEFPPSLFATRGQERAKVVFREQMQARLHAEVSFPTACRVENLDELEGELNQNVFYLSPTVGVQRDIPRSSRDPVHRHLYQIASQYNCAESPGRTTPPLGAAMSHSSSDFTQGPLAQRTNPVAFEYVTAFLTHLGFNMMKEVLPSAGMTYEVGSAIEHGYLCPTNANLAQLTTEFQQNYHRAEYVCYESLNDTWPLNESGHTSHRPVYIMLQAAPAIAYSGPTLSDDSSTLQKYAALANYLALFQEGLRIAHDTNSPVVIHAAAVGGGVFGNRTENIEWGFKKAALYFQNQLVESLQTQHPVIVQLENFRNGTMWEMGAEDHLNLQERQRVGG